MSDIGYAEYDDGGLCEYISLYLLFMYNELFVSSGFFSDEEMSRFLQYEDKLINNTNIKLPVSRYHEYNYRRSSFTYNLYEKLQWVNIKEGRTINSVLCTHLNGQNGKFRPSDILSDWSASVLHTSHPEEWLLKYNIPVMLSFAGMPAINKTFGHNIVLYGYDKKTNKYAAHYGWSDRKYANVLLSKSQVWFFTSWGFWYAFRPKEHVKRELKKNIFYDGKWITSKELPSWWK